MKDESYNSHADRIAEPGFVERPALSGADATTGMGTMTPDQAFTTETPCDASGERPLKPAMWRGWARRCPCCGTGPMLRGYLQVRPACPACGEALYHHRADDGPAYLTILIVGHIMAPAILIAFVNFRPDPLVLASVFTIGCVGLSLYLLPRLKGMLVAFQWAKRMHGFGGRA